MPKGTIKTAPRALRVLVVQDGARHNFAVPAVLQRAGMLEAVYVDLCADKGLGRWLSLLGRLPFPGRIRDAANRLRRRTLPPAIKPFTRSLGWQGLMREWRAMRAATPEQAHLALQASSHKRGAAIARRGLGRATHVFTTLGDAWPLRAAARAAGVTVVSDIISALSTEATVIGEVRAFPDWCDERPYGGANVEDGHGTPNGRLLSTADIFLCPSEFVRDDLIANHGVAPERTRLVPYAVSDDWIDLVPEPVRGRVLFVATAWVGKGIHYLAKAANILRARGRDFEFRVAGDASETVRGHPEAGNLHFLGRLPRSETAEEFRRADVFCLPTLSEGSAMVNYEAMAAGLPVITTPAAGSVIRDGVDGLIVPTRDPVALAAAIERVIDDRALREAMSAAARQHIRDYTWTRFGERLIAALGGAQA